MARNSGADWHGQPERHGAGESSGWGLGSDLCWQQGAVVEDHEKNRAASRPGAQQQAHGPTATVSTR